MTDLEKISLINSTLQGQYTQWDVFGMQAIAILLVGLIIFFLVGGFIVGRSVEQAEENYKNLKKHMTYALTVAGMLAIFYGAYLILKL